MIALFNWFTKITAWPVQKLCFRTKIHYENKAVQGRHIHGPAIVVSNHTSVYDYAVMLFVFYSRTLRYQMAEILFRRPFLGLFLKQLGGIYVDRDSRNFDFLRVSEEILKKGGVVGVFPESRLPDPGEATPLPFKSSVTFLALSTQVPIIPVYTNGSYFKKQRAEVIIGEPIDVFSLLDPALDDKANLGRITEALRRNIIRLGEILHERSGEKA